MSNASSGKKTLAKPRSSIRHSLNLSSVGKALADVINKEEKAAKRARESNRRLSAINLAAASRSSFAHGAQRTPTPDTLRTITRATRRNSALPRQSISSDESGTLVEAAEPPIVPASTRLASLRPTTRSQTAVLSALPKYRPRSVASDAGKKELSPAKATRGKPLRSSTDEEEGIPGAMRPSSAAEKLTRGISPTPHRGALKINLTSAMNITPTKADTRARCSSPPKATPPRPAKAAKTAVVSTAIGPSIPRPTSARSCTSSPCAPKTPQSSSSCKLFFRSGRENSSQPSTPSRSPGRDIQSVTPSPKRSRRDALPPTPTPPFRRSKAVGSPIVEDNSEDDVIMLLAPVASPAAPTPAMPRTTRLRKEQKQKQSPTRAPANLPGRNQLSYPSPTRPASNVSSSLRPPTEHGSAPRGSLLSWEQLAAESSVILREDEVDKMLSDVPPPFVDGPYSPPPSAPRSPLLLNLRIPDSPALSALSSPGGFGSISQVLLPDVTPSPAVHAGAQQRFAAAASEAPAVDAAIVTLLRLQLASAENIAKERLARVQAAEHEVQLLKAARAREAEETGRRVSVLEERLRESDEVREREDEERAAEIVSLEDHLRQADGSREEAVRAAVQAAQASQDAEMRKQRLNWQLVHCAGRAAGAWSSVQGLAESELELVRSNREMLAVLMAELERVV